MLSVIVPVWNQTDEIAGIVENAIKRVWDVALLPTEVIVVDNNSAFSRHYQTSAMTRWTTNKGIASAWNEGVRLAHGDVLCFLNSDCFVEPGWDKALYACAIDGSYVAFPWTNGVKNEGVGVAGWCWVVSRKTFDSVGSFDETFVPCYYEDTDWFHRAQEAGCMLWSVPDAGVLHTRGGSTNAMGEQRRAWLHWSNRFRYAYKHGVDPADSPPFWQQPLPDWQL